LTRVLAVVVLYQMTLEESSTWRAMSRVLRERPEVAASVEVMVADNSPEPQAMPEGFTGTYLHDSGNAGLAPRYNRALEIAAGRGIEWLLLFDQDTNPTEAYFLEVLRLTESLRGDAAIGVIAPKLVMNGRILSPHAPVFRKPEYEVELGSSGVIGKDLRAFNSGAVVRVSDLQAIGGFPEEYWLDYLDHATFHRIQELGKSIYVMDAVLDHELSDATPGKPVNPVRLLNRLKAEERFYAEYGTVSERVQHQFDLLRQVIGWGRRGEFGQAKLRLKALLRMD